MLVNLPHGQIAYHQAGEQQQYVSERNHAGDDIALSKSLNQTDEAEIERHDGAKETHPQA